MPRSISSTSFQIWQIHHQWSSCQSGSWVYKECLLVCDWLVGRRPRLGGQNHLGKSAILFPSEWNHNFLEDERLWVAAPRWIFSCLDLDTDQPCWWTILWMTLFQKEWFLRNNWKILNFWNLSHIHNWNLLERTKWNHSHASLSPLYVNFTFRTSCSIIYREKEEHPYMNHKPNSMPFTPQPPMFWTSDLFSPQTNRHCPGQRMQSFPYCNTIFVCSTWHPVLYG